MINTDNNNRIAKNTLLLYFRMLLMMAVSLYTSRIVLRTLGVEDFGIYNVVGGIVAMFGFINSAMASGTQRYLTFELGRKNRLQLHKVFCTSVNIHVLISLLILILAETIGLWFFYHKMTIPMERIDAALWVYQFSILSTIVTIMSVPYNATIIAHEKMSAFAYISILEAMLKLSMVYLLFLGSFDKLKLYALLMFTVQLLIRLIYSSYCKHHFTETRYLFILDKNLFKEMLGFAGWNLWGNCAFIAFTQGLNILLNLFFGPTVNAARGISVQVQNAVVQFSYNFQMALNPQITKSYATNNYSYMHSLIFRSSKLTFFLLLFLSMPIMMETQTILTIWLETVPDYTIIFLRLMLCTTVIDAVANPLIVSVTATGKVKKYQSILGGILLSILPLSYITLKLGGNPTSVFVVHLCICSVAFIVRLFIIRPIIQLSLSAYACQVISKCLKVTIAAAIFPLFLKNIMPYSLYTFITICSVCTITVPVSIYFLGLNLPEKQFVCNKIFALLNRSHNDKKA